MVMDESSRVTAMSAILGLGGLTNILLVLCMGHTWRYWRQVKFYVLMLLVGNLLDVVVTQGLTVAEMVTPTSSVTGSTGACRFLMFAVTLGPSLSAMAVAALSLHVLLTCLTHSQGNRLRHGLVLGLFVLLSLPLPLAKIPMSTLSTFDTGFGEMSACHLNTDTMEGMRQLMIGESVALLFFPLFVTLLCSLAAVIVFCTASRATDKGDEDKSDLILTYLLGGALLVFYTPYFINQIVILYVSMGPKSLNIFFALLNLMSCFPFITALISIVFAYVHAYRNRGDLFMSSGASSSSASGERQKLVN